MSAYLLSLYFLYATYVITAPMMMPTGPIDNSIPRSVKTPNMATVTRNIVTTKSNTLDDIGGSFLYEIGLSFPYRGCSFRERRYMDSHTPMPRKRAIAIRSIAIVA